MAAIPTDHLPMPLPLRFLFLALMLSLALPVVGQEPAAAPPAAEAEPTTGEDGEPAKPVRNEAFYVGEASVTSQGAGERQGAVARALIQVLVRISGDRAAATHPVIRKALGHAENFALDTTYRQDEDRSSGAPQYRQTLVARFDPSAVDALIAAAGLRYWTAERPKPLLWLAIDDGRGARLVTAGQLAVVRPLALRGLERGLRFGLPAGSAVEQAAVQTVWAQNAASMQSLSGRYGSQTQLLGKLYRSAGGWTSDWLLSRGDSELARWSANEADPQRAIAAGADGAADALAKRDAVAVNAGAAGAFTVEITGVRSADDYLKVAGYLQALAVVRRMEVLEATSERLQVRLDLLVGLAGFATLVEAGGTLHADPGATAEIPRYQLQP